MAQSLTSIPEDLLFDIMCRLDGPSILSMAMSCRALYQIFQSDTIKYIYELDMSSMQDAGSGKPAAELLDALRDREKAWADLNWSSVEIVKADPHSMAYDHVAGAFAQTDGRNISVHWLPSISKTENRTTTRLDTGFWVRDFMLDVGEDLVVFLHKERLPGGTFHGRLYCRTISTNEPHSACLSAGPLSFQFYLDGGIIPLTEELEVVEDVLFLTTSDNRGPRILIWNWKMGFLIHDFRDQLPPLIHELDVVQRDVFIVASRADSGKILIYQITPTMVCIPVLIATLSLPGTNGPYIRHFQAESGRYQHRPTPGALFLPSPTSRMHVFAIGYSSGLEGLLFVRSSTFSRYVHCRNEGLEVAWSEWGEQESRFLEKRLRQGWRRYAHGNRIVCIQKYLDSTWIEVLNFSSSTSLTSRSAPGLHARQGCFRHDNPTIIEKGDTFEEDVVTRLPYHVASRKVSGKTPFSCMIDEDRIVGLEFVYDALELTVYSF
ncbi:unnamed protein product [Cyclocybe aegerita]|uniref:F-box domain-containing protein n=1 Tax=Cyclocybe aegerita TaxID=1973307 RepID=A0A8S0WLX9_CYCAE|nr:unnamed protein product [Cyclocybe aegerita]